MQKTKAFLFLLLFCIALVPGCAQKEPVEKDQSNTNQLFPLNLPATFTGSIPCPDCEKVEIVLNLRPDNLYQLRKTYISADGGKQVESHMRNWRYDKKENQVILGKHKGALKTYGVLDQDTLRFIGIEGTQIDELINYDLKRMEKYDPFGDTVKIRGMFSSIRNIHTFTECSTGLSFPVDPSGKFSELDRAYRNTPHEKGEALLVSLMANLISSPAGGDKKNDIVIVNRFNRIYPEQDCSGKVVKNSLFGVNWTVVELGGNPIQREENLRRPFFVLEAKGNRVKGHSGCNRFFGTFLLKGDIFIFNTLASTRMACPGQLTMEDEFLRALDTTESYVFEKEQLILLDKNDEPVMKMERSE